MSRHSKRSRRSEKNAEAFPTLDSDATGRDARDHRYWLSIALLLLLPIIVYLPLLKAGYIWDDDDYVQENETLRSWSGLADIWFVPRAIPQYYPLVHTTFWLEYRLWELDPTGYHVVNVLLHALSAILLWRLLTVLKVPGALLAAAIFAVHPVMVESVAWITERKNVLSLALALGSLLCYFRFEPPEHVPDSRRTNTQWKFYLVALALFIAALLSKTVVCTVPAVILVIFWWKRGTVSAKSVVPLIPLFVLGISLGLTTAYLEKHHVGALGSEWSLTMVDRVLLAGRNLWFYAGKLVWPEPLIFFYPRWEIDASRPVQYLYPLGVLVVLVTLWLLRGRMGRGPLAAVLIFAGVLFPALGFIDVYPFRYSFVADHFQYHASLGLITLAAATLTLLARKLQLSSPLPGKIAAGVLLVALGLLTYRQSQAYQDLETIYLDTLAKNPLAWNVYGNLVDHYSVEGRHEDALRIGRLGVQAVPEHADVYNALGGALLFAAGKSGATGQELDEANANFQQAVTLDPRHQSASYNLATALILQNRHAEAIPHLQQVVENNPADIAATVALAKAFIVTGHPAEAAPWVRAALELDPQHPVALHCQGLLALNAGRVADAIRSFQAAVRSNDSFADAHFDLAGALAAQQDFAGASRHYRRVIQLQPQNVRARNNLGVVYMNLGQTEAAIEQFAEASRLAPSFLEAHENLQRARQTLTQP